METFSIPEHVEIKIHTDKPILLVPFADIHGGAEEVDYKRFAQEVEMVGETDGVYAISLGDLTDSMFWGGSGQDKDLGSYEEQNGYMRSVFKYLTGRRKMLASWAGDHDKWSADRGETIYRQFVEMGVYYLEGVSYMTLNVNDTPYRIVGAHRHNGYSIYNKSQAAQRIFRDSGWGADIALVAHNHKKGYNPQPFKGFGGDEYVVHLIQLAPYKYSDEYLRKKGYPRLKSEEMGAFSILLYPDQKEIEVLWDIKKGLKRLKHERQ
jgi:hypothetical protein